MKETNDGLHDRGHQLRSVGHPSWIVGITGNSLPTLRLDLERVSADRRVLFVAPLRPEINTKAAGLIELTLSTTFERR
jgi:hypothetical protein